MGYGFDGSLNGRKPGEVLSGWWFLPAASPIGGGGKGAVAPSA